MELEKPSPRNLEEEIRPALSEPELLLSFPKEIAFYGIGRLVRSKRASDLSECAAAPFIAAFEITGEESGLCVVAFDQEPLTDDSRSMFLELANILAGKLVTALADYSNSAAMISPPHASSASEQKHRLLRSSLLAGGPRGSLSRVYDFKGAQPMTVRLAYLPGRPADQSGGRA